MQLCLMNPTFCVGLFSELRFTKTNLFLLTYNLMHRNVLETSDISNTANRKFKIFLAKDVSQKGKEAPFAPIIFSIQPRYLSDLQQK